jgi:hypothetical protein
VPRYVSSAPPAPPAPAPKKARSSRRKKVFSLMAAVVILTAYGARFGLWGNKSKPVARTTTTVSTLEAPVTVAPGPVTTLLPTPARGAPGTTR